MSLYCTCQFLDECIAKRFRDTPYYTPSRRFPREDVTRLILCHCSGLGVTFLGRGRFKIVFSVPYGYVLKVGSQKTIAHEMRVYNRTQEDIRQALFVPILWSTRYFILQEKVEPGDLVPADQASELLRLARLAKATDIRYRNFGKCRDGRYRLFDFFSSNVSQARLRDLQGWLLIPRVRQRSRNPLDHRLRAQGVEH